MLQIPLSKIPQTDNYQYYYYDGYNITDCIFMYDTHHLYKKRKQNEYYIGVYTDHVYRGNKESILEISIALKTFYHFQYSHIIEYFNEYRDDLYDDYETVQIMKLDIKEDVYHVIIKTHWIRLIQRVWKKIFSERCRILNSQKSLKSILNREINGRRIVLPGLNGMLSNLK